MTSGILHELEESIRAAKNEYEVAILRAERALHLARRGGESERLAGHEIEALRKLNLEWGDPGLSARCHLAEGMLQLTIGNHARASDSLERARAVSASVGDRRSECWAIALQAFLSYVRGHTEDVPERVRQVIDWIGDADPLAVARVKMLTGQLLHFAGRYEMARVWYRESRDHAMSRRDDGFVSALLFNIASHHVCSLRHQYFRGEVASEFSALVSLAVESFKNYDEHAHISSQESFTSTLQASVYVFSERYSEAVRLLREVADVEDDDGLSKLGSACAADHAFCLLSIGSSDEAAAAADAAEKLAVQEEHPDISAYTKDRLAQVFSAIGLEKRSIYLREAAELDWARFERQQRTILDSLERWGLV